MTQKTTTEIIKSVTQTLAASVVAVVLSWAPSVASAEGDSLLRRSNYSSISGSFGVFDNIEDVVLSQYRDRATGTIFYVVNIEGRNITLNVDASNVCQSFLESAPVVLNPIEEEKRNDPANGKSPIVDARDLSFSAKLTHRQYGNCAVFNSTEWELSINAYDPQGRRQGFALIQLEVRRTYRGYNNHTGFGR